MDLKGSYLNLGLYHLFSYLKTKSFIPFHSSRYSLSRFFVLLLSLSLYFRNFSFNLVYSCYQFSSHFSLSSCLAILPLSVPTYSIPNSTFSEAQRCLSLSHSFVFRLPISLCIPVRSFLVSFLSIPNFDFLIETCAREERSEKRRERWRWRSQRC